MQVRLSRHDSYRMETPLGDWNQTTNKLLLNSVNCTVLYCTVLNCIVQFKMLQNHATVMFQIRTRVSDT